MLEALLIIYILSVIAILAGSDNFLKMLAPMLYIVPLWYYVAAATFLTLIPGFNTWAAYHLYKYLAEERRRRHQLLFEKWNRRIADHSHYGKWTGKGKSYGPQDFHKFGQSE